MKKGLLILLALVMVFSLAACNGDESVDTPSPDVTSDSGTNVDEQSAEGVDMTLWIFLNPESEEDPRNVVLKEIVEEYNSINEYGNTVTVESIHWSKFESQCIQAAASGTGPDIINIYTDMLNTHVNAGTVQPMTEYAESFIGEMPDYVYKAEDLKIGGEIYTLPWESRTFLYWYRTDIFDSAPNSLDELLTAASENTSEMSLGFAMGLSDAGNGAGFMETFIPILRSASGKLLDENGKAVFNTEAGVQTLEYFKSLVDASAMDKTTLGLGVDETVDGFKSGTILSCNVGTQRASAIKASDLSDNIASAPIPGFEEGVPSPPLVAGQSLGIGAYAQDPDASFDFIKYFYSEENQKKWLMANVMTVRTSIYEDEEIKALSNYDELQSWSNYAATGSVVFYPEDYTELSINLVQAAQRVIFQDADAQSELDEVANWYNEKNGK